MIISIKMYFIFTNCANFSASSYQYVVELFIPFHTSTTATLHRYVAYPIKCIFYLKLEIKC
jgi:hypothetical protein